MLTIKCSSWLTIPNGANARTFVSQPYRQIPSRSPQGCARNSRTLSGGANNRRAGCVAAGLTGIHKLRHPAFNQPRRRGRAGARLSHGVQACQGDPVAVAGTTSRETTVDPTRVMYLCEAQRFALNVETRGSCSWRSRQRQRAALRADIWDCEAAGVAVRGLGRGFPALRGQLDSRIIMGESFSGCSATTIMLFARAGTRPTRRISRTRRPASSISVVIVAGDQNLMCP